MAQTAQIGRGEILRRARAFDRGVQVLEVADVLLEHVRRAGRQAVQLRADQARLGVGRQQHHADAQVVAPQRLGEHDPVRAAAEVEIRDEHVERLGLRDADRLPGAPARGDDDGQTVVERGGEGAPQQRVVLDDEKPSRHGTTIDAGESGTASARRVVPRRSAQVVADSDPGRRRPGEAVVQPGDRHARVPRPIHGDADVLEDARDRDLDRLLGDDGPPGRLGRRAPRSPGSVRDESGTPPASGRIAADAVRSPGGARLPVLPRGACRGGVAGDPRG